MYYLCPNCQICTYIIAPAIKIACQKSGFSACLRKSFRQTSSEFFGAGAIDLFRKSGAIKISALLLHSWKASPTMSLMKMNIEAFVLEAGLYGNIWNHNSLRKALRWCSSHSWIYHVAKFMIQYSIEISPSHDELGPGGRGDKAIMQIVSEKSFSDIQLTHINEVRMANGVISISDLTVADGSRIDTVFLHKSVFEGDRNQYNWPEKHDIKPYEYETWILAMERIFNFGFI